MRPMISIDFKTWHRKDLRAPLKVIGTPVCVFLPRSPTCEVCVLLCVRGEAAESRLI